MNNVMKKYGGLILFYGIIIVGVIMLNARFRYLNNVNAEINMRSEIAFQN